MQGRRIIEKTLLRQERIRFGFGGHPPVTTVLEQINGGGEFVAGGPPDRFSGRFPWRSCSHPKVTNKLWSVPKLVIGKGVVEEIYGTEFDDVTKGSIQAFQSITDAIFHNSHHPVATTETQESQESQESVASPALSDICESRLANFYRNAITATEKAGNKLHFQLHGIENMAHVDNEIIIYGRRDFDSTLLVRRHLALGVYIMEVEGPPRGDIAYEAWESTNEMKRAKKAWTSNQRHLSLRLTFEVTTRETFWVKGPSGDILQGSEEPQECKHILILESAVENMARNEIPESTVKALKSTEWTAVDLDYWCEGNEFWVKSKLK